MHWIKWTLPHESIWHNKSDAKWLFAAFALQVHMVTPLEIYFIIVPWPQKCYIAGGIIHLYISKGSRTLKMCMTGKTSAGQRFSLRELVQLWKAKDRQAAQSFQRDLGKIAAKSSRTAFGNPLHIGSEGSCYKTKDRGVFCKSCNGKQKGAEVLRLIS